MSGSRIRLLIVGEFGWNHGSSQVVHQYVRHAAAADMEIAVARRFSKCDLEVTRRLPLRGDIRWATHLLIVMEAWPSPRHEDLERIDRIVPRHRRAVVDTDGHWNPRVAVGDDDNTWPCGLDEWRKLISAAGEIVLQPSIGPPASGAIPFPYFGLPARSRRRLRPKGADVQYVGNNWYRRDQVVEVMSAARQALGEGARLRLCGSGWDKVDELGPLGIDVRPSVPFGKVVERMGDGVLTPVLVRPVLGALRLLSPRMLETPAANTIPFYSEENRHIGELYGDDGGELAWASDSAEFFTRALRDRKRLERSARAIYPRLVERYSYPALLRQLRALLTG